MDTALPAIPAKRYFTIGEVSELCGVKAYVLRYWEQEFTQLRPMKRRGNRRYYQHHEVLLIRRIRELLYDQGFTISGARNRLAESMASRRSSTVAMRSSEERALTLEDSALDNDEEESSSFSSSASDGPVSPHVLAATATAVSAPARTAASSDFACVSNTSGSQADEVSAAINLQWLAQELGAIRRLLDD